MQKDSTEKERWNNREIKDRTAQANEAEAACAVCKPERADNGSDNHSNINIVDNGFHGVTPHNLKVQRTAASDVVSDSARTATPVSRIVMQRR